MDDSLLRALQTFEAALDQVAAGLRQNLYEHIVRNPAGLDKAADEIELGRSGGGKADLNLLDADLHKHVKEALLLFSVHRIDPRLVAVAHIRSEPAWRFGDDIAGQIGRASCGEKVGQYVEISVVAV